MNRPTCLALTTALLFGSSAIPAQGLREGSQPPDTQACVAGASGPAVRLRIQGFKNRAGGLIVRLYSDRKEDFLAKGRKLKRIELPVPPSGDVDVCVALPGPNRYAIAVLHDANGDTDLSTSTDGVGFTNNPKLGLGKPPLAKVVFTAQPGVRTMPVILNYKTGFFSVGPIANAR
ncbi:hypothetical protein ACFB49_34200 [Sphingomonas sp. DBB INV C78]|uniref:DUF2141 domain-containing protein n=1 Tax=Sphingomonas sp. DBB INV C78 TaxID=3349434 RepID=UPI0036D406B3